MLIVLIYLGILAVAAAVTFTVLDVVHRSEPPGEGSNGFFAVGETPSEGRREGAADGEAAKRLFDEDSVFVAKANLSPQQRRILAFLEDHCPALPVRASSTTVLTHPTQFYAELKRQISMAKESIFFSALYIGDGPLSRAFVSVMEEKVKDVVADHERRLAGETEGFDPSSPAFSDKPFEIGLLLDYNRMHDRRNLVTLQRFLTTSHAIERQYHHHRQEEEEPPRPPRSAEGHATESSNGSGSGSGSGNNDSSHSRPSRSPIKVRLYLYQGPCRWNRLFEVVSRAKEVLGVQHAKVFVFDGRSTLLTGANLSDDYFTSRMDRYVLYEDNEHLSYYFGELLRVLFAVSHPVVSFTNCVGSLEGTASSPVLEPRSPLRRVKALIAERRRRRSLRHGGERAELPANGTSGFVSSPVLSMKFIPDAVPSFLHQDAGVTSGSDSHGHGSPTLHRESGLVILPNALGVDPSRETAAYCVEARELCLRFAQRMSRHFQHLAYDLLSANLSRLFPQDGPVVVEEEEKRRTGYDSVLFPTLQFGRVGIFHDSFIVEGLLSLANHHDHLYLTSPYLNVYADFLDVLIEKTGRGGEATRAKDPTTAHCHDDNGEKKKEKKKEKEEGDGRMFFDVITASVKTNGWAGQRGFPGYIPFFYLQLERSFFFLMKAYRCLDRVRVFEYTAEGLTFHAKGLYFLRSDGAVERRKAGGREEELAPSSTLGEAPYLVAYGSTNYGYRSVHKDVEVEGFLFSFSEAFREQTRLELSSMLRHSTMVEERQFKRDEMGRFQPVISLVAQMGQNFL